MYRSMYIEGIHIGKYVKLYLHNIDIHDYLSVQIY